MSRSTRKPASAPCSGSNADDKAAWHRAERRAVREALAVVAREGEDDDGSVDAAETSALVHHGDPWGWATDGLPSLRFVRFIQQHRPETYAALCRK